MVDHPDNQQQPILMINGDAQDHLNHPLMAGELEEMMDPEVVTMMDPEVDLEMIGDQEVASVTVVLEEVLMMEDQGVASVTVVLEEVLMIEMIGDQEEVDLMTVVLEEALEMIEVPEVLMTEVLPGIVLMTEVLQGIVMMTVDQEGDSEMIEDLLVVMVKVLGDVKAHPQGMHQTLSHLTNQKSDQNLT